MKTRLSAILVRLGESPYERLAFAEQRDTIPRNARETAVLRSGDSSAIYAAAGAGGNAAPPKLIVFPRALTT